MRSLIDIQARDTLVLEALSASVVGCLQAPYADLLTFEFEEHQLILTSGSLEGCYLTMGKKKAILPRK